MTAPVWAANLLGEVWAAECPDAAPPPALIWWRGSRLMSSGRCGRGRIHVTAGHRPARNSWRYERLARWCAWDQRVVLIHEIAHALRGVGHGHDEEFWRMAWRLHKRYRGNVPYSFILDREGQYRVTALQMAERLAVPGARAAMAARRQVMKGEPPMTDTTAAEGSKRCPGVATAGLPAHDAPLEAFSLNAKNPDGRARLCRTDASLYTKFLRAQKAGAEPAAAAAEPAQDGQEAQAPAIRPVPKPVKATRRSGRPAKQAAAEAPMSGRDLEVALIEAGGAGTDAGQALLASESAKVQAARRAGRKPKADA